MGEKTPGWRIHDHWLVEDVGEHTCGAGPGSGVGCEPWCGFEPMIDLQDFAPWSSDPGWPTQVARALAAQFEQDARADRADAIKNIDAGMLEVAELFGSSAESKERDARAIRAAIDRHAAS